MYRSQGSAINGAINKIHCYRFYEQLLRYYNKGVGSKNIKPKNDDFLLSSNIITFNIYLINTPTY